MSRPSVHTRLYRIAVRLYPAGFRAEYGESLIAFFVDLVADIGPRRAWRRVVFDLARTVPRYRWEALMSPSRRNGILIGAAVSTLLTGLWLFFAVADLSGGWTETLRHWWSTLPAVAAAVSLAVSIAAWRQRRGSESVR